MTTTIADLPSLLRALAAEPSDAELRAVVGDALEEGGRFHEASLLRLPYPVAVVDGKIDMGATQYVGSDRYAYSVVGVVNKKTLIVRECRAVRVGHNDDWGERQEYTYSENENSPRVTITLRNNGRWVEKGQPKQYCGFAVGHRDRYSDPSF